MAGHARYTAVLDACVLYPVCIADALMSMAVAGLFAAKWTTLIEDEWIRNLEERRPDLVGKLVRRRDDMRQAIPDWEVLEANWRAVASGLSLPDPDDVHVLAAAIAGHADCIVTAKCALNLVVGDERLVASNRGQRLWRGVRGIAIADRPIGQSVPRRVDAIGMFRQRKVLKLDWPIR